MSQPLIPGGYILLSRKIIESKIWKKPPLYIKVWVYLLMKAQHQQHKGLKKGQLRASIPELIEACSWKVGFRIQKPTKDQIFQVLEWLRSGDEGGHESNARATMITTMRATHGLLVTIDKYCIYQDPKNYESNDEPDNEKAMKPARRQRQPDNTNKNVKNDKNDKKESNISISLPEFQFIKITSEEHAKLVDKFGEFKTKDWLEALNLWKGSKGKSTKSDYLTILNWDRNEQKKNSPKNNISKKDKFNTLYLT